MKIETARNILKENKGILEENGCPVPKTPSEAKDILDKYNRGEIDFCNKDADQELIRQIYNALTIILCSEMGNHHHNDPKRADREAAEAKKRKRNHG